MVNLKTGSLGFFFLIAIAGCTDSSVTDAGEFEDVNQVESASLKSDQQSALFDILKKAKRIPSSSGWFEIIKLPNEVYAFWEPGHIEKVNAFLILGSERDVLYDTGMGIASIATAVKDVRIEEGLPIKELMVINSHNHLDHNGGNNDFDEAWIIENDWGIEKLTEGLPAEGFESYWNQLTPHTGVAPPADFDPANKSTPPFPRENIRFLKDGDTVDLGNRQFTVIHTISHSPDGLALYDAQHKLLFGGDTFYGAEYLITELPLLVQDLERSSTLDVAWHYASHGAQLIETMQHGLHLSIVRRMLAGEGEKSKTTFAGFEMPIYELDGVSVTLAGELLLY